MAKFIVTLKQHTPLIHFQWYQKGAILRASEVKPKLDRFLKECVFEGKFEEYKHYLIGYNSEKIEKDFKEKEAFDYKLRVHNVINLKVQNIELKKGKHKSKCFPNYFGNMGKKIEEINKFVYCDCLDLEFFSLNKKVLRIIKCNLPQFLMKYNFGQRQSKGFGSFFINNQNKYFIDGREMYYDKEEIRKIKKLKYSFSVDLDNPKKADKHIKNESSFYNNIFYIFNEINEIYSRIRSGKDKFDPYIKIYSESKQMLWEKCAILENYCGRQVSNLYCKYIIKDLLGLSSTENWIKYGKKITKKHCSTKKENVIERYQSPIFFKPIKLEQRYVIYFEGREICQNFLDEEFLIQCNKKGNLKLKTPKEFDIDELLEYVKENDSKDITKNNRW
ncbi:hypothetical protein [Clostridium novyi]|uniref:hypothetical protein n=1 Tax=Clostridium novyi TaxID=1542 RepID=UPI00069D45DE|nr:hypothetical protein [Clostridium novyi]